MKTLRNLAFLAGVVLVAWGAAEKYGVLDNIVSIVKPVAPPIAQDGLRVLIVEENSERDKLSPTQREILLSTAPGSVRDYCKQNCVKVGVTPEFRLNDQNDDVSRDGPAWKEAMARKRGNLPWIVISGGPKKGGVEMEIKPTTKPEEILALLKRYTP